ncbi:MAG: serine/threonine-protein kinase [Byssovorax sp.]
MSAHHLDPCSSAGDAVSLSAQLGVGTIFAGRYRVVRCIAAGGMGAVYEVVHLETDRRHALKVMHAHLFESEDMRDRFKLEARIAAQIESDYIVYVSDAGVDLATAMPFLVMELLRGEELGVRLKRLTRLPPEEVVTYMEQAAWALDRTHAAAIVHRDLKPQNLFLTLREDGSPRIKILDFGVAKLIAESSTSAGGTQSLGTPIYMAPEQFRGRKQLTGAADIYALTMMTYTLLVGKAYWAEESKSLGDMIAFAMHVVNGPQEPAVERAARHGVALPIGFDAWFAKGTAIDPAHRFATATEAVRALREVDSSASFGVAVIGPRPAMWSEAGASLPEARPAIPSIGVGDRVATSTGAAVMTPAPVETRRLPRVAAAVVVGLAALASGTWFSLRKSPSSHETSHQAVEAPSAAAAVASSAATIDVVPSEGAFPPSPSASTPVAAAPSPRAGAVVKATSKPTTPRKKPIVDETNYTRR